MPLTRAFGIIFVMIAFPAGPAPSRAASEVAPIEIRLVAQEAGGGPVLVVEAGDGTLEVESETLLGRPIS